MSSNNLDGAMTVYATTGKGNDCASLVMDYFENIAQRVSGSLETGLSVVIDDTLKFEITLPYRPEEIIDQANGMANYFTQQLDEGDLKQNIGIQLSMFDTILGFTYYYVDERTNDVLNTIFGIASLFHGFVLDGNMKLYTHQRRLLIDGEGNSSFDEYTVSVMTGAVIKARHESEYDIKRRQLTFQKMTQLGFEKIPEMPSHALDANTKLRDIEDVLGRFIACYCTNVVSELVRGGHDDERIQKNIKGFIERYQIDEYLSSEEQYYINNYHEASSAELNKFGWRYECSGIFAWSLNLCEIPQNNEIVNVQAIGDIVYSNNWETLLAMVTLKSKEDLLQKYDEVFRQNWACVDARVNNESLTAANESICYFRQYALEWLLSVDNQLDFDTMEVFA